MLPKIDRCEYVTLLLLVCMNLSVQVQAVSSCYKYNLMENIYGEASIVESLQENSKFEQLLKSSIGKILGLN